MSKRKKRLERIRQNPKNVSFEELRQVLEDYGFVLKRVTGSHHIFEVEFEGAVQIITIPFRRPIKPIYVEKALVLIDQIIQQDEGIEDD